MTQSLFRQYETQRKFFAPGTILETKGSTVIQEMEILEINFETLITFKVLKSSDYGYFRVGEIITFTKEYLELNYKLKEISND